METKVLVVDDPMRHEISFFMTSTDASGEYVITYDKVENMLRKDKLDPNNCVDHKWKPLLKLPRELANTFIRDVVKYAKHKNIQTEDENLLKGKLESTQEHLKDMQKITKHLLKIKE